MQRMVQNAASGSVVQSPREPNILEDILDEGSITISPNSQPGLDCLADAGPNERPPYSNFTLVKYAILGSPNQKLTLSEIYETISTRFPWFQNAGQSWKNSVRHCLSLDTQFYKEPRPPKQPGKGGFWKVSVDTPRGNKRQRKRNKKPRKLDLEAFQHSNAPSSFPLITPAFRDSTHDYATTIPASSTKAPVISSSTQSGWTPYFPPDAMKTLPVPALVRYYAEATCSERQIPQTQNTSSTNHFKLSSASCWDKEDEADSEVESEEEPPD